MSRPDVVAFYLSPRAKGNSDILMDEFLRGVEESGGHAVKIYSRKLNIQGCIECGGCDDTGECVLNDAMDDVYPLLIETKRIAVAVPIFFYGPPAQGKALIDRSQALWNRVRLKPELKKPDGRGFMLGVGASKGDNLFEGTELCIKYFLDACGIPLKLDVLNYRRIEAKGAIKEHPTALKDAYEAGGRFLD